MSVEENLRVVEAYFEAFNAHDLDRIAALHAESVVFYVPDSPEPLKGRAALRERFQTLLTAFPDARLEKVRTFGQDAFTCSELTFAGTHKGPLPGPGDKTTPATNKPVRFTYVDVHKFEEGEIAEVRVYRDRLGMMTQLGLAP